MKKMFTQNKIKEQNGGSVGITIKQTENNLQNISSKHEKQFVFFLLESDGISKNKINRELYSHYYHIVSSEFVIVVVCRENERIRRKTKLGGYVREREKETKKESVTLRSNPFFLTFWCALRSPLVSILCCCCC